MSDGLKVAFDARELTAEHKPAGIARYIHSLFTALAETGEARLTALCDPVERPPFHGEKNIETLILPKVGGGKWGRTLWERFRWGALIDRLGVEVFHSTAHLSPGPMKTPMVLTVHDATNFLFPHWYPWTNRVNRSIQLRRGVRLARRIIAVSESTRRDVCRLFPEALEKTEVIHEAVEPMFKPASDVSREQLGLNFDEPFLFWVGTFSPRKNLLTLLRAMDILRQRGRWYPLVLAGQRGWKDSEVFQFVREKNLERFVHHLGYVERERLPLLYSACDLFVFPSFYEGFGLPVLEAMACGAAVLAANASSMPEIVPLADMLFDPGSPEELAEKIQWVMDNNSIRDRLCQAGLAWAKEFSWNKAARETLEVYREVVG